MSLGKDLLAAAMVAEKGSGDGGGGGTTNYNQLTNKPQINGVILTGNKSASDLGIDTYDDTELRGKVTALEDSNAALTASMTTAQGDITNLENNKVEKEAGLGLSQNSFTDAEKTKLAGLENYDDTALQGEVDALDALIVALAQTVAKKGEAFVAEYNVTTAQEIIEFINGNHEPCAPMVVKRGTDYYTVITATKVEDNRAIIRTFATLSGVFYIFTYDITNKSWANNNYGVQKVLVSGTDIKTVNGQSLLGSGNIDVGGGGSTSWDSITGKPTDLVQDAAYVHTDNNFTNADKAKVDNAASTSDLNAKQDTLVSGTNIKTVGGQSLLGSGDIFVPDTNYEVCDNDVGGNVAKVGEITVDGTTYGLYQFYLKTGELPNTTTAVYSFATLCADYTIESFIDATGVTNDGIFIGNGRTDNDNRLIVQQFSKNSKTVTIRTYKDFTGKTALLKILFYGTKSA